MGGLLVGRPPGDMIENGGSLLSYLWQCGGWGGSLMMFE